MVEQTRLQHRPMSHVVRTAISLGAAAVVGAAVAVVVASPLGERLNRELADAGRRAAASRPSDPFQGLDAEGAGLFV